MSDIMTPIPFESLMNYILQEYEKTGRVFGVSESYKKQNNATYSIFGGKLETVFGPAAGPHTQLAQNIVASYFAGSRFFELKTVQQLDGEDLPVAKPCIKADDECYNVEWSTELIIPNAFNEYVKAWFALKVLAKEFGLGSQDGFVFNMSVGYDLDGIKSPKINKFIEGLKDTSDSEIFNECKQVLNKMLPMFKHIDNDFINSISAEICSSVTLSTLHGCPPAEIERIATYLITEKHLNTFIKCNPTLLGYEYARKTMDDLGYDYIVFDDFHFKDDLQYADAVPMIQRLIDLANSKDLVFGVKLTNTFPVTIAANELPGQEMYMSGRSLYPLTVSVADKLAKDFNGKLRMSFSGGIDAFNAAKLFECGIWPITMATTFLKPGGYGRMVQIAQVLESESDKLSHKSNTGFDGVSLQSLASLKADAVTNPLYIKDYKPSSNGKSDRLHRAPVKPFLPRKSRETLPIGDCFMSPCSNGCPINQDIPEYIRLAGEGRYTEALDVITRQNPLPFITGTICPHRCTSKCTRMFYEDAIKIRATKLECAENGFDAYVASVKSPEKKNGKAAVIGGGPGGLAAAYFLARAGVDVTIFEKREQLGGVIRYAIPEFRIASKSIDNDIAIVKSMGVTIKTGTEIHDISALLRDFDNVIVAVGAHKDMSMNIDGASTASSLEFLEKCKNGDMMAIENVVVVGGGNTAMDCARAAKRIKGNKDVALVYRRTMQYMPADTDELVEALDEGVKLYELASPEKCENGVLTCRKMKLGEPDASGRRSPVATDETFDIKADLIVTAVGAAVDEELFAKSNIERKKAVETNDSHVYTVGDCMNGAATVVEAIRDAKEAVKKITGYKFADSVVPMCDKKLCELEHKKTILCENAKHESERCLECGSFCENCVTVCPNRANVEIKTDGKRMPQILHIDSMCNECGNCLTFCPYAGAPYLDKLTLFADKNAMDNSKNHGFFFDGDKVTVRVNGDVKTADINNMNGIDDAAAAIIKAVYADYKYLLF